MPASHYFSNFILFYLERFDHSTEDDHSDEVISVTSCPKMRLFASASLDGSVRIWDESCRLRRILKLNATPSSMCFSSERGDLIVAIGDFLHKIKYATCKYFLEHFCPLGSTVTPDLPCVQSFQHLTK